MRHIYGEEDNEFVAPVNALVKVCFGWRFRGDCDVIESTFNSSLYKAGKPQDIIRWDIWPIMFSRIGEFTSSDGSSIKLRPAYNKYKAAAEEYTRRYRATMGRKMEVSSES